jgi:hypothetical protein
MESAARLPLGALVVVRRLEEHEVGQLTDGFPIKAHFTGTPATEV